MTSNGLAAARRVRLPRSETKRAPGRGRRGSCSTIAASVRPWPMPTVAASSCSSTRWRKWAPAAASVAERQRPVLGRRRHGAESEAEALAQPVLEHRAVRSRPLDEDPDQAGALGGGDEAGDLDARHAQPGGDLLLREPADVGQPGRLGGEPQLEILQPEPPDPCHARAAPEHLFDARTLVSDMRAAGRRCQGSRRQSEARLGRAAAAPDAQGWARRTGLRVSNGHLEGSSSLSDVVEGRAGKRDHAQPSEPPVLTTLRAPKGGGTQQLGGMRRLLWAAGGGSGKLLRFA